MLDLFYNGKWNFDELLKYTVEKEEYDVFYKNSIYHCVSYLLKIDNKYYIIEKGPADNEFINAPYMTTARTLKGIKYVFFPRNGKKHTGYYQLSLF